MNAESQLVESSQRLKKVFQYLKSKDIASSNAEIGRMIGINDATYLSKILNGKKPLTDYRMIKLALIDPYLNLDWIQTGEGDMLLNDEEIKRREKIDSPRVNDVESKKLRGMTIDMAVKMLYEKEELLSKAQERIKELELHITNLERKNNELQNEVDLLSKKKERP